MAETETTEAADQAGGEAPLGAADPALLETFGTGPIAGDGGGASLAVIAAALALVGVLVVAIRRARRR
ncbi:MAG: hypothetical protein AAF677_10300 [Pseudomonadota bacterium]